MLSETNSLPEKFCSVRTSDLLRRFFLLIRMLRFCFLHLNLTITVSFFSNSGMLEDHQVSPRSRLEKMPCKRCFQEHHHQQMQEQDLFPAIHGNDIDDTGDDIANGIPLQLNNSFSQ